jgi:hypothetical protein
MTMMLLTNDELALCVEAIGHAPRSIALEGLHNRLLCEVDDRFRMGERFPAPFLELVKDDLAALEPREPRTLPVLVGFSLPLDASGPGSHGEVDLQAYIPLKPWRFVLEVSEGFEIESIRKGQLLFTTGTFNAERLRDDEWRENLDVIQTAQKLTIRVGNVSGQARTFAGGLWCRCVV